MPRFPAFVETEKPGVVSKVTPEVIPEGSKEGLATSLPLRPKLEGVEGLYRPVVAVSVSVSVFVPFLLEAAPAEAEARVLGTAFTVPAATTVAVAAADEEVDVDVLNTGDRKGLCSASSNLRRFGAGVCHVNVIFEVEGLTLLLLS